MNRLLPTAALALLLATPMAWADPETDVIGHFDTRSETGELGTLTVLVRADGKYYVVRRMACEATGPYELHGVGQLRRGLLLVQYESAPRPVVVPQPGEGEADPETPSDDPHAGSSDDGDGGNGGLVGGLDEENSSPFPETESTPEGTVIISASVGKNGVNLPADVLIIQEALERRGFLQPGYEPGEVGPELLEAIRRFQIAEVGFRKPDSRVDTDQPTIRAINGGGLAPRAFIVYGSVGAQGINDPEDVKVIQGALVQAGYLSEGEFTPGVSDPTLIQAIKRYQVDRAGFTVPDGRVDINHRTLNQLNSEPFAQLLPPANPTPPGSDGDTAAPPEDEPLPEVGLPLPDIDVEVPGGDEPAPADPETPGTPSPDTVPPALLAALPELDPELSVGAYLIAGDALTAVVHDATCPNTTGKWTLERGARRGQKDVGIVESEGVAPPEGEAITTDDATPVG